LALLESAFLSHNDPFRTRRGTIRQVNLRLPWKKPDSKACVVEVSDIYILLEPVPEAFIRQELRQKCHQRGVVDDHGQRLDAQVWESFLKILPGTQSTDTN
jgi:hypothetical protein